jgi:hypothetical protein
VRLLAAANAWQGTRDNPKVTYRGTVSRGYQYDVVFNGYDIGDKVPITDTDFGLSADEQRISDLTYNVFFGGYDLILSEAPLITFRENITQRLDEVEKTQDATDDQEVTEIRKRRTTGTDVINTLTDPTTLFINHDRRTRRGTVDARHQSYQAGTLDYSIKNLDVLTNLGGDDNSIRIESGTLTVHNWRPSTLNRYDIREITNNYANPENYNPIREFSIATDDITFPDNDGQFLYAKVPTDGISTTGTIVNLKSVHRRLDYDTDYNYYKLGYISDSNSPRQAYMLWGNVKLNPSIFYDKVIRETPAGVVDGVNTVFTLTYTPLQNSDEVYLNGQLKYPAGVGYTLSGNTITFGVAPWVGSLILVKYIKQV